MLKSPDCSRAWAPWTSNRGVVTKGNVELVCVEDDVTVSLKLRTAPVDVPDVQFGGVPDRFRKKKILQFKIKEEDVGRSCQYSANA